MIFTKYHFLQKMSRTIMAVLASSWKGQTKMGTHNAPDIIYRELYKKNLLPNLQVPYKKFVDQMSGLQTLYQANNFLMKHRHLPLNIGGDHSISGATLAASLENYDTDLRVIWVDAHADINTYDSSPSGNIHGMPVASAMQLFDPWIKIDQKLKPKQIMYIGLRDIDDFEKEFITSHGILNYTVKEIDHIGIDKFLRILANFIQDKKVHYSFDIDVLDPVLAASTGTPVPKGFYADEIYKIQKCITQNSTLVNCDFVEYNPEIGSVLDNQISLDSITKVIQNLIDVY